MSRHHYYAQTELSSDSNDHKKLYMRKYNKRIFAIFYV